MTPTFNFAAPPYPKDHPTPAGWRLLLLPKPVQDKTASGIYLPDQAQDISRYTTQVCYVVAVGPDCYTDPLRFSNGPWCKVGDWVLVTKYAGSRFTYKDTEFKIFNDDEIIALVANPDHIKAL